MITHTRLLERDAELTALRTAAGRASTGDGDVIALRGTAGIGKTRLLVAAAAIGREAGMHVLQATASRLEYDHPFGLARQLLERDLLLRSDAERNRLLTGPARLGAQALAGHADGPAAPNLSPGAVHGLYWIVANLSAEAPLLVTVDDVQWSDPPSLQFLSYLARRVADLPVLLVAAARLEQHEGDPQSFGALFDAAGRTTLRPEPLTEDGVRALVGGAGARPVAHETARRLHVQTGGNPFLIGELARARTAGAGWDDSAANAPETVSRAILGRIRDAGPHAGRLVDAVVALGDGCPLAEAAAVAALEAPAAADVASALMRAGVFATSDTLGFAHPLVRTAVEDTMTPVERSNWHATAARTLDARGAQPERVALQWMHSSPSGDQAVARLLADAGREALVRGAPDAAERFLSRALDEGPDGDQLGPVLARLGESRLRSDRFTEAASALRRARNLSRDDAELLERTLLLWMALIGIGPDAVPEGVEILESTIRRLADRESRLMLESEFVNVSFLDASWLQPTWERLARFADLTGETPAERRLLSMTTIKLQYASTDSAEVMAGIARRAYGDGKLVDENPIDPTKWIWAIEALILTDRLDEAQAALHRGAASAAASGSLSTLLVVDDLRSLLWLRRGRVADAGSEARDALARLGDAARTPVRRALEIALVRWSLLAMTARGEFAEAEATLARHDLAGELPAGPRQLRLLHERAVLRLAQRRPQEALGDLTRLGDFHARHGIDSIVEAPWRIAAALAHSALRDTSAAVATADEHLRLIRRWGLPRDVGVALRTRAQVETDLDARVGLLEAALALHRDSPAPLELAETTAALGAALRRTGRRSESRDLLGQALELATRCGATALVGRARDELRLAGGQPRVRSITGVDALTPGELRIAQLAAAGLSNREIAQELFLSVRTAENTLRRVYQKLSITSRRELAPVMNGSGAAVRPGADPMHSDGDHR